MKIAVKYQTQIKRAAGLGGETVELGGDGSLRNLLQELAARRGDAFRLLVLREDGMPRDTILVFVGDHQVTARSAVALREGDVVTLLAPMAGG